ncbi:MAG: ABC transporter ATP-binding protein [Bacteroidia bacterium]|nr:ABC transporter ATP-binding protein [Bacteroidia bacterium]MDW8417360.1 ABC transporter ATP-binding protein [Bacteroidia bacterium]
MPKALLHATKLRKAYEGRPILEGIDLVLEEKRFYALVGHSGSGKTTLLYLLALLERADEGEIFWRGEPVHNLSPRSAAAWRNTHIGFVFQFFHLIAELRVWENVALPAVLRGSSFRREKGRAIELLSQVGLQDRANELPTRLSGGEQQRVAIARALFLSPPLILADEPTGNLDSEQAVRIWKLFTDLTRQVGASVLVATHNLILAESADHILQLSHGRLYQNV